MGGMVAELLQLRWSSGLLERLGMIGGRMAVRLALHFFWNVDFQWGSGGLIRGLIVEATNALQLQITAAIDID
jgi:hypothetical protein